MLHCLTTKQENQTDSLIYVSTKTAQTEAVRLAIWLKLTTFNKRIHQISEKQQHLHRKGTMRSLPHELNETQPLLQTSICTQV